MKPRSAHCPAVNLPQPTNHRPATVLAMLFLAGGAVFLSGPSHSADIFKEADIELGQKLIAEHKCVACHVSKVGGDGSAMYKPQGRINTAGLLRGMVEMCNTQMNLGLFPEEVTAVAAVLNRDHYKFK
jgi:hypothetical protein